MFWMFLVPRFDTELLTFAQSVVHDTVYTILMLDNGPMFELWSRRRDSPACAKRAARHAHGSVVCAVRGGKATTACGRYLAREQLQAVLQPTLKQTTGTEASRAIGDTERLGVTSTNTS